jgi:hypothetical protein
MDIMGLPKRMLGQFNQMNATAPVAPSQAVDTPKEKITLNALSSMSERISHIASEFNVKALEVKDIAPLQASLKDAGIIQANQVRAQGLLTQLAYKHYEAGPMDLEKALEEHVNTLKDKPAVLADHQEGKHVLNTVRNLISAREQQTHAA